MRLLVIDRDMDFRKRFSAFLASICSDISITVCSDEDDLAFHSIDHIIFDEGISDTAKERIEESGIGFTEMTSKEGENGSCRIYKFQSAAGILRGIPAFRGQLSLSAAGTELSQGMKIFCVSGFSGGCGKTSFSLVLARMLRQKSGEGVLIIGTSQLPDLYDHFPDVKGENAPDMNLLLLNYASGSLVSPSSYLLNDGFGVSCLRMPSDQVSDLASLTSDEMGGFLEYIREWNLFGALVIDMTSELSERNQLMYSCADMNFLISDDRHQHEGMEKRWFEAVARESAEEKFCRILNFDISGDSSGNIFYDDIEGPEGTYFDNRLPADPESFAFRDGISDICMSGAYAAAVEKILKRLRL